MDFDRDRFAVWNWKHPLILHWILNPGLAINELVLGQRYPATVLIDKTSTAPLPERQYVPCSSCGTHNPYGPYSKTQFGNYAGLVCASCGETLPSVKNVLTWLVLMVTWPIWKPFERRMGPQMRARQLAKLQSYEGDPSASKVQTSGLRMGLMFGGFMGVFFVLQALVLGQSLGLALMIGGVAGALTGLVFGVVMKLIVSIGGSKSVSS